MTHDGLTLVEVERIQRLFDASEGSGSEISKEAALAFWVNAPALLSIARARMEAERGCLMYKPFSYIYRWNRCGRKGQRCKVTARGSMNSCRLEFPDGFVMITSRNALKRANPK